MPENEGEAYIRKYPTFQRWINQCVSCQAKGYKPEMPDCIGQVEENKVPANNIRRFFNSLVLNENGLCEICERFNEVSSR